MKTSDRLGFTLIELVAVVCIIAFLSTIAVTVYRRVEASRYDSEALAAVEDFSAQALRLINDRGVSSETDTTEIHTGCVIIAPKADGTFDQTKIENANFTINTKLAESTSSHWQYRVCIGFADSDQKSESFVVSAHRNDSSRAIVAGAAIDAPVTFADGLAELPAEIRLFPAAVGTAWKNGA